MYLTLEKLGIGKCWHGYRFGDRLADNKIWLEFVERKWPSSGNPADSKPITREDFDTILYDYAAVTDIPPAVFWTEMLDAYPDAKVILVEREVEAWYQSFSNTLFQSAILLRWRIVTNPLFAWYTGIYSFRVINECFLRYFGAKTPTELMVKARSVYIAHNEAVREKCRKEGRPMLEYKLGSGLKPICDFLEVEAPVDDMEFPSTNEAPQTLAVLRSLMGGMILGAAVDVLKESAVVAAVGAVAWVGVRRPEVLREWSGRLFSRT